MSKFTLPLKIFLCHASADKPRVRELYIYLRNQGLKPWLDAEDLLPGQQWQTEIPKALNTSDVIIVCLSKQSINKEGYVQKEIKYALDRALEMPDGRIFLIPVKLEECEVPFSLSRYHWVNLFEEDGHNKLTKSLTTRAEQVIQFQNEKNLLNEIDPFPSKTIEKISKISNDEGIYKAISSLNEILKDSSPELKEEGNNYMEEYYKLVDRVSMVNGADFPNILIQLNILTTNVNSLANRHQSQLESLKDQYETYYKKVYEINEEIKVSINHAPRFDNQTIQALSGAYETASFILQDGIIEKYSWLIKTINQMRTWIQNADPFILQTREKRQAFLVGKRQVEQLFGKTESEIRLQRKYIERKWGWFRNEALLVLDIAEQSLEIEMKEWKRLEERNWTEYSITRAIAKCEQLSRFSDKLLNGINQRIGGIRQKQIALDSEVSYIKNLTLNNATKLSKKDQQAVLLIINLAKQAQRFDSVETYLDYAVSLALRRINSKERKEVTKIVNFYSQGGPVFMGKVDNRRGKIMGKTDVEDEEQNG